LLEERCEVLGRLERNYKQYFTELDDSNKDKCFEALIAASKPTANTTQLEPTLESATYLITYKIIDKQLGTNITISFADKATKHTLTGTSIIPITYLLDS
jgi:hypothetical protein